MPVRRLDLPIMSCERRLGFVCCEVIDLQRGIVASCHVFLVIGRKREVTYWLAMGLNVSHVVEICLPELHYAIMICRNKPLFTVRVDCCSYGRIVSLEIPQLELPQCRGSTNSENGLKVKGHAVP